ncbi:hypothetical protein DFH27DRAFT_308154 [Peziza echinospora]|nr:hypothetical protein DFH27DRAFT_308154 [Peziza echinospora]
MSLQGYSQLDIPEQEDLQYLSTKVKMWLVDIPNNGPDHPWFSRDSDYLDNLWRESQQDDLDYANALLKLVHLVDYEGLRATSFNEWQYIRWLKQEIGVELDLDTINTIYSSDIDFYNAQQTTQEISKEKGSILAEGSLGSFPGFKKHNVGEVEILRCHDLPPGLDTKHARCALDGIPCPYPTQTPRSRKFDIKKAREFWQFHEVLAFFESTEDGCQCTGQRHWKANHQKFSRPLTAVDLSAETVIQRSAQAHVPPWPQSRIQAPP